jgi:hypothetical protein
MSTPSQLLEQWDWFCAKSGTGSNQPKLTEIWLLDTEGAFKV